MYTKASFRDVITITIFGNRAHDAIIECGENLTELASLPLNELGYSIGNLHKALANHGTANRRVHRIQCSTLFDEAQIMNI